MSLLGGWKDELGNIGGALNGPADGPKAKPSSMDIVNAVVAGRNDERYQKAFMPLELQAIQQAQDPKRAAAIRSTLAGTRNADVAGAEGDAIKAAVMRAAASHSALQSGANVAAFGSANNAVSAGLRQAKISAGQDAQKFTDAQRANVVQTGRGLARDTAGTATTLAGIQDNSTLARLRARAVEQQAQNAALGQVALYGAGALYNQYQKFNPATNATLGGGPGNPLINGQPIQAGGLMPDPSWRNA